jgi:hypothetical protein
LKLASDEEAVGFIHDERAGKTRSLTQTSPTSPLKHAIFPEDLDSDSDTDENAKRGTSVLDNPLQLSPLCLSLVL